MCKLFYLKRPISPVWPAILWFITVTVLLCLPGTAFPHEKWYNKIWLDKWIHIFLFAILTILFCRAGSAVLGKKLRLLAYIAIGCFIYGVVMEFIQKYFIPFRSFDVGDIIADGIGSALGLIISIRVYIKK